MWKVFKTGIFLEQLRLVHHSYVCSIQNSVFNSKGLSRFVSIASAQAVENASKWRTYTHGSSEKTRRIQVRLSTLTRLNWRPFYVQCSKMILLKSKWAQSNWPLIFPLPETQRTDMKLESHALLFPSILTCRKTTKYSSARTTSIWATTDGIAASEKSNSMKDIWRFLQCTKRWSLWRFFKIDVSAISEGTLEMDV